MQLGPPFVKVDEWTKNFKFAHFEEGSDEYFKQQWATEVTRILHKNLEQPAQDPGSASAAAPAPGSASGAAPAGQQADAGTQAAEGNAPASKRQRLTTGAAAASGGSTPASGGVAAQAPLELSYVTSPPPVTPTPIHNHWFARGKRRRRLQEGESSPPGGRCAAAAAKSGAKSQGRQGRWGGRRMTMRMMSTVLTMYKDEEEEAG
eukprot:2875845-Pyramimonas_sp.AAC.1